MDAAKQRWLIQKVEKLLDFLVEAPDDKVVLILRFEGKNIRDIEWNREYLDRYLARPR